MKTHSKYYLIESGPTLELVEGLLADRQKVAAEILEGVRALGGVNFSVGFHGKVQTIWFEGEPPKGYCKPNRNGSYAPRRGSKAQKAIGALPTMPAVNRAVERSMGIPNSLCTEGPGTRGTTSSIIGAFPDAVGIAYYDNAGPYLLWLPDVDHYKASALKQNPGCTITHPAPDWSLDTTGLREILKEEWDLMRAKHKASLSGNGGEL